MPRTVFPLRQQLFRAKAAEASASALTDEDRARSGEFKKRFGLSAFETVSKPTPGLEEQGVDFQGIKAPTEMFRAFLAGAFGGQPAAAAAPAEPEFTPGEDPNTMQAAAARQDALAFETDDPVVAGRREALLARRGRGKGLTSLNRGFTAKNLLATTPV